MTTATLPPPRRNGLLMLALVAGLLALPFAIAAGLYVGGWKPARTIAHGRLLDPPLELPASGLRSADGQPLPTAALQGKWLFILRLDGPCRADCAARIDEMRRLQVSLNKDMGRLRRVVLAPRTDAPGLAEAGRSQPDLLILAAPDDWLGKAERSSLHIVDPLGRRVMDYPAEVTAKDMRADLERLLKFAWTG
uniref:Probable transmembrane protein n=1 Tax=Dechloromonas aromatica (strain RCB) TaxID=159087 RepID=Q47G18_DECAR